MAKEAFFKYIKPAPLTEKVSTRDGCIYMYRMMKFIGWIPTKTGVLGYLYSMWTFTTFTCGAICLPLGFSLSYFIEFKNFTPDELLTSMQVGINVYGSSVKCIILYICLWRLRKAANILDELDKRVSNDSERQKIHEAVAFSNYVFLIFTMIYHGFPLATVISYLASGRPPWSLYNPFMNWRDSKANLFIQTIWEYMFMSSAVVQDQLSDTYLLVFLILIRAHFNLLKDRVRDLRTDPNKSEEENYHDLVNCIKDHRMILRCCDMIRPIISGTIFVQFGLIGIVLGITLINIFFFSNFSRGLSSVLFMLAVLMQTFPFCYNCNILIDDCEEFGNRMFQSNWIDAPSRYKTTLLHFLHQAQQPITFTAGGIIPITLNSNITVAKFAFSIITIVREMNLAEKLKKMD